MKIKLAVVGKMRAGSESDLVKDYVSRFDRTGRALGLGPLNIVEVEAKKGGMNAEAGLLSRVVGTSDPVCILDERGKSMTSPEFAEMLATWRDQGRAEAAFVIGGADGIDPGLRASALLSMSLGKMVWPHMMARVMLTEQLYRAASILSGAPYHRK
ncbi:MAG: 23S rRNA (pseudouridine(1915)-N(3))-methyltransferase RlmH [Boseongicola sp.]